MRGYPENHCFSNHLLGMTVQQFDDIYDKEVGKRYTKHDENSAYQKEKTEKEK